MRHHRIGIPDLGVTSETTYDELVGLIRSESVRGGVYVHCWGGVGRTGTVIGCLLADDGLGYDEIVDRLSSRRAGTRKANRPCPETPRQRDVLRARAAARPSPPAGGDRP